MKKRVINKQKVFIFISIVFITFCIVFYGFRFVYYYRQFNKKTESGETIQLLSSVIRTNNPNVTIGDGLYNIANEYIFKGKNVNNYVMYSGLLWRIVKINNDGSINLVTEDIMNEFMWGTENSKYNTSQVRTWLNKTEDNTGIFYKNLYNPEEYLKNSTLCLDTISNIGSSICKDMLTDDMVGMLSLSDYTNSIVDDETYLNIEDEYWLSSLSSEGNAWFVDFDKISKTIVTDAYGVRPTVTLNSTVSFESGDGSKENPYTIGYNEGLSIGRYVNLDGHLWIVYEVDSNNVRLALDGYINEGNLSYSFGTNNNYSITTQGSLGYYLNNDFYEALSYKDKIVSNDWYIGEYNDDYTNVYKDKVLAKVGLYNLADIKLNNTTKNYYLLTKGKDSKIFVFDMSGYLFESSTTQKRFIKPAITIQKSKILSGNGTQSDPYVLEG